MSRENVSPKNQYKYTPPTNKKVRNPFDKALIDRLHKPICSPGMCKIYKKQPNSSFRWDIDQTCTLVPTEIVACNSQFEPSPDPHLEQIAEEATEKFFSQEYVMPSPLESSKKTKPLVMNDASIQITSLIKDHSLIMRDVSAQTVLSLPPVLPPEVEKILWPFCTYTQDQNTSAEYEIRRQLFFEEHSDIEQHYDSEQTDDEIHVENRPPSTYEHHTPLVFSPELSQDLVKKGMKRTFGTPLNKDSSANKAYRNKILDVVDFGEPCFSPIQFQTPLRTGQNSATSSSLASVSISPVAKAASSDEEKNNFTSPESDAMATCLDCIDSEVKADKLGSCNCKKTPTKLVIKRSASLKESPQRGRKASFSFSEKRSLSMSSLHRSRSVQKLDFSMEMSIDGSMQELLQGTESSSPKDSPAWSLVDEKSIQQLVNTESSKGQYPDTLLTSKTSPTINMLDDTPVKVKSKSNILCHEISKMRALSPLHMSLDCSSDSFDNPLSLEDKNIDFNNVDLKILTDNSSQINYTQNELTKTAVDCSSSFKRLDSGFNENTFYTNASSYYESAIKPSELTVNASKVSNSMNTLKEISNVHWMRYDSGFNGENSSDCTQFYNQDNAVKKMTSFRFSEAKIDDKENVATHGIEKFSGSETHKNDALSMSDIFTDEMTFNCNFSSTPSKNKTKKVYS